MPGKGFAPAPRSRKANCLDRRKRNRLSVLLPVPQPEQPALEADFVGAGAV